MNSRQQSRSLRCFCPVESDVDGPTTQLCCLMSRLTASIGQNAGPVDRWMRFRTGAQPAIAVN